VNTSGWVYDIAELAFNELQNRLNDHQINVQVNFLDKRSAIDLELTRTMLDWRLWFKEEHFILENRFSLARHSKGRPPVVIGAAVYSYDIKANQVSIHMLEHFKNAVLNSALEKRMAFCAFFAAYLFADIVGVIVLKINRPVSGLASFYQYWGFIYDQHGDMKVNKSHLLNKLRHLGQRGGVHDFEWPEEGLN
jgi:hypothetical protein